MTLFSRLNKKIQDIYDCFAGIYLKLQNWYYDHFVLVKDPDLPFEIGDHLRVSRWFGLYDHHGIYIGKKKVVDYLDDKGITISHYGDFKDGKEVKVVSHHEDRVYTGREAARRAYRRALEGENEYNLIFHNCEHFANWCITGEEKSDQVKGGVALVIGVMAFAAKPVVGI